MRLTHLSNGGKPSSNYETYSKYENISRDLCPDRDSFDNDNNEGFSNEDCIPEQPLQIGIHKANKD